MSQGPAIDHPQAQGRRRTTSEDAAINELMGIVRKAMSQQDQVSPLLRTYQNHHQEQWKNTCHVLVMDGLQLEEDLLDDLHLKMLQLMAEYRMEDKRLKKERQQPSSQQHLEPQQQPLEPFFRHPAPSQHPNQQHFQPGNFSQQPFQPPQQGFHHPHQQQFQTPQQHFQPPQPPFQPPHQSQSSYQQQQQNYQHQNYQQQSPLPGRSGTPLWEPEDLIDPGLQRDAGAAGKKD